jgi:hypothetical protein
VGEPPFSRPRCFPRIVLGGHVTKMLKRVGPTQLRGHAQLMCPVRGLSVRCVRDLSPTCSLELPVQVERKADICSVTCQFRHSLVEAGRDTHL